MTPSSDVELICPQKNWNFFKNGKPIENSTFNNVVCKESLYPFIGFYRGTMGTVNFGAKPFQYPIPYYNSLVLTMTDRNLFDLSQLFEKYKSLSNPENLKSSSDMNTSSSNIMDAIHDDGMIQFQADLGTSDDEGLSLLLIAWKLNAHKVWEITRDEWMNGFWVLNCWEVSHIKRVCTQWKSEIKLKTNPNEFRKFYFFLFDYLKEENKTILSYEEAKTIWGMLLFSWVFYTEWISFLESKKVNAITKDVWTQLFHFILANERNIDAEESSAWNSTLDDFIEFHKKVSGMN